MNIQGFQVIDHKLSELPQAGKTYNTSIIEVRGCRFAATVAVDFSVNGDPFVEAQGRAIKQALSYSERSDFQLFGRASGGFSKGGGKGKDPNATAAPGYIGSLFSKGLKEYQYKRYELQDLIASVMNRPYEKDLENSLTNGQVETLFEKIKAGVRIPKSSQSNAHAASGSASNQRTAPSAPQKAKQATSQQGQNQLGASDQQLKLFTALFKKMGFKSEADREDYYAAYLQGKTKPESKEDFSHLINWFKVDTVKLRLGRMGLHDPKEQAAWVSEYLGKSLKQIEDLEKLTSSEIFNVLEALDSQIAAA